MKPHKHSALIKAWADGATIQAKWRITHSTESRYEWRDDHNPNWNDKTEYRVRPRNFEEGAFYPAIDKWGLKVLVQCTNPKHPGPTFKLRNEFWTERYFNWIGKRLEISWPVEEGVNENE